MLEKTHLWNVSNGTVRILVRLVLITELGGTEGSSMFFTFSAISFPCNTRMSYSLHFQPVLCIHVAQLHSDVDENKLTL